MSPSTRIRNAIRTHVLGLVAIYIALTGTALALPGTDTVDSGDIKNSAVKSAHVANGSLKGVDIDQSTLTVGDAADLHCPAVCIEAGEIGDGQIVPGKLALPMSISQTTKSGPLIDVENGGGSGTRALRGSTGGGVGVEGMATGTDSWGVHGRSTGLGGTGVVGRGNIGVHGTGTGTSGSGSAAVLGNAEAGGTGVRALSPATGGWGLYAEGAEYAAVFQGNVSVNGTLSKPAGSFRIDHPLHPANKYLQHSFVESPDMKNVYDGVVTTDEDGFARVQLPDWFDALNRDFRYQLTVLGRSFAEAIVWREIEENRFVIRSDEPVTRVSWQVTGIRKDAYAKANPIEVELPKRGDEQGRYLTPEAFGKPQSQAINRPRGIR